MYVGLGFRVHTCGKKGSPGKHGRSRGLQVVAEVVDVMVVVEAGVEVVVLDPHGRRRGCSRSVVDVVEAEPRHHRLRGRWRT